METGLYIDNIMYIVCRCINIFVIILMLIYKLSENLHIVTVSIWLKR